MKKVCIRKRNGEYAVAVLMTEEEIEELINKAIKENKLSYKIAKFFRDIREWWIYDVLLYCPYLPLLLYYLFFVILLVIICFICKV